MPGRASEQISLPTSEFPTRGDAVEISEGVGLIGRVDPLRRWVAWGAVLVGSANIFIRVAGQDATYFLPLTQTFILFIAVLIANKSRRLRPLTGFLLTIAVLRLGWFVLAPMLGDWAPIQNLSARTNWGARLFLARLLNVVGALVLLCTFIGRRLTRRDLFLRIGELTAPARPEPILWFRRPIRWTQLGPQLLIIFGLALPAFLFFTLRPDFGQLSRVWQFLPWAMATAALNAANEEFQFRCVPLAHLRDALPVRESLWLTAVFFGVGHYFGQPSGPIGVVMATIAGWIWAKSMVETRGVGWAFGIHLVQDIVIFCFLAMSVKS